MKHVFAFSQFPVNGLTTFYHCSNGMSIAGQVVNSAVNGGGWLCKESRQPWIEVFNDSRQAQYALFALWALFSTTNLIRVFCVIQLLYLAVLLCSVASRCRSPQKTAHTAGAVINGLVIRMEWAVQHLQATVVNG